MLALVSGGSASGKSRFAEDLAAGATYVSLMERNLETLREKF